MFDYLGILLSVILGLALTHLLTGLSRLIQARRGTRIWWPHIFWVAAVLIYVLAIWWGMYWWRQLHVWTIQNFLFLALYSSVLFLLSSLLFPHETGETIDFERFFMDHRRWFFALLVTALLLDVPETLAKSADHLRQVPVEYAIFLPVALGLASAGLLSADRRLHRVLSLAWVGAIVCYLVLSSLDRVVAG